MPFKVANLIAKTMIGLGLILMFVNLVGLFYRVHIEEEHPFIPTREINTRTLDEKSFWSAANKRLDESSKSYTDRLTLLVNDRLINIDSYNTRPTLFENWLYFIYVHLRYGGRAEYVDPGVAVRVGGGLCSQHAILMHQILKLNNINSRILALDGHVVNEVQVGINSQWLVYDADYGVITNSTLRLLEERPDILRLLYHGKAEALEIEETIVNSFISHNDNVHFLSVFSFQPEMALVEKISYFAIWLIPIVLFLFGFAIAPAQISKD